MKTLKAQKLVPRLVRGAVVHEYYFKLQFPESTLVNFHYLSACFLEGRLVIIDRYDYGNDVRHAALSKWREALHVCGSRRIVEFEQLYQDAVRCRDHDITPAVLLP